MEDITPSTPPPVEMPGKASREKWRRIAEQVRGISGKGDGWAYVGSHSPGVATHIRMGRYRSFLPTPMEQDQAERYMQMNWEVTTRKQGEPGRVGVWIRYVGTD